MMTDTQNRVQLWDLIKDIKFAMFTTHHANGHLHGRPMTTQNRAIDEDNTLWFFMSRRSEPVADIERDSEVNVSYSDPDKQTYVSVSGHADVVEDEARKRRLWSAMNEAWFPQGPDDPDVALVRVTITHADYWDSHDHKLVRLFEMAKAAITGQPPRDMGDRGHVRMN
ncbi:MAG: pyridoxamine 5'-phosphate oxidase family protein [Aquabacterium sp.]